MKKLMLATLLALPTMTQAHEVWIERDGSGPARIYLGEPAEPPPEGGDPEFPKLKAPKLLSGSQPSQRRMAGFIEVDAPAGDVRAWDDNVFAPWGPEGKKEGVIYYARAGRSDTRAQMPLEIVPATANGDRFILVRDGKPVAGHSVTVVTPDKWSRTFTTDESGGFSFPVRGKGRYLLSGSTKETGPHATAAGSVQVLHRTTTTTFVAK
ncbi:DUF4198 domain-containing protein [Sphingomonas arantia]|uniref:DUF4198 domain-containing protein n=1 Tax=Sphingomonas arantia TaxID=1460676 RepID=A0ABW4U1Z4_9SPHN